MSVLNLETSAVAETALESLLADAQAFVVITDEQLRIRMLSTPCFGFLPEPASDFVGSPLAELFPLTIRKERLQCIRMAQQSNRPVRIHGMIRGHWMTSTYRPVSDQPGAIIACSNRPNRLERDDPRILIVEATSHDLGPLSGLTERELEVLHDVSLGFSTREIAARYHRSPRTIESHRRMLGLKLGARNRADLTWIAIDSGIHDLTIEQCLDMLRCARAAPLFEPDPFTVPAQGCTPAARRTA